MPSTTYTDLSGSPLTYVINPKGVIDLGKKPLAAFSFIIRVKDDLRLSNSQFVERVFIFIIFLIISFLPPQPNVQRENVLRVQITRFVLFR